MSRPSKRMTPSLGKRRSNARPSVDLPEPELADDADGLALTQRQADAVHGLEQHRRAAQEAAAEAEDHLHIVALEKHRRVGLGRRLAAGRLGGQQHLGVGMRRRGEDLLGRPVLHHLAAPHDVDAVGETANDAEIVGDEDDGHAEFLLQLGEQRQDLRLDGHVERGGRLVGDQDVGVVGERHGDHHPLPLAARQLVRIGAHPPLGFGDLDQLQKPQRLRPCGGSAESAMAADWFDQLVADRVERVERGHRLLEDHGDAAAAHPVERRLGELEEVMPAIVHHAASLAVGGEQAHRGHHRLALARAGLADDGDGLPGGNREPDAFHRLDDAVEGAEANVEVAHLEDGLRVGGRRHASGPSGRARRAARRR